MKNPPSLRLLQIGAIVLSIGLHSASAQSRSESRARVDISAIPKAPIRFSVDSVSAGGHKEERKAGDVQNYVTSFPATDEWKEGSLTITPETTGSLAISLLGPYVLVDSATKQFKPVFIEYDDVKVKSGVIKNGGFELAIQNDVPSGWNVRTTSASNPPVDETNRAALRSEKPFEGTRYIRVWHNSAVAQVVLVEENVQVVITFMYRLGGQP